MGESSAFDRLIAKLDLANEMVEEMREESRKLRRRAMIQFPLTMGAIVVIASGGIIWICL